MSVMTGVQRVVMLVAIGLVATACHNWEPVTKPATDLAQTKATTRYRITTIIGAEIPLTAVQLRNDSIVGTWDEGRERPLFGLPMSQVKSITVKKFDAVATIALAGSAIALTAIAAASFDPLGGWGSGGGSGGFLGGGSGQPISCPLIYSWDGHAYRLDSGTFGGAITPALARTDMDNLIHARPIDGVLKFRMTAEAPETEHVDAITVLAVDHPTGTTVAPDARANTTFHVIGTLHSPIAARDRMRSDILPRVVRNDGVMWEARLDGRDPANSEHLRDGVEVTFARPATDQVQLVIDGQNTEWAAQLMGEMVAAHGRLTAAWYDPATTRSASAPIAQMQREEGFLSVEIWNGTSWIPVGGVFEAGPEVAKRQLLPLDLHGIPGNQIRLRLESAPAFWMIDYVGLAPQIDVPVTAHTLTTTHASSSKYPDALSRLTTRDSRFLDMERGDMVDFTVQDAAPVATGMTRSYLLRSSGWYQVHGRDHADPIATTLAALAQPHGAARQAVVRLNEALAALSASAAHVGQR